jgi:hypothetical protein
LSSLIVSAKSTDDGRGTPPLKLILCTLLSEWSACSSLGDDMVMMKLWERVHTRKNDQVCAETKAPTAAVANTYEL